MEFKLSQGYHQSSSKLAKSYTCSFCKRGFLNAQALGGHMNIHRKDRAKLKESSKEVQKTGSSEEETFKAKNDCNHKANEIDCFSETSSQDHGETKNCVNGDSEKNKDLICGLEKPEIDLELRLGLEHI